MGDIEEFLLGYLRLKGEAKTLDVLKLQFQSEWIMHNMVNVIENLEMVSVQLFSREAMQESHASASASATGGNGTVSPRHASASTSATSHLYRHLSTSARKEQWQAVINSKNNKD